MQDILPWFFVAKLADEITVGDGEGRDYTCKLTEIDKKCVTAEITDIFTNDNEPKVKITLFQGLPKADKMELVIQKCIEIGVDSIVPVKTEHTVVKLDGKEEKKIARWNKIAESAAKQCGRGKIPVVENVMTFKQAVEKAKSLDMAIIPYEKEEKNTLKAVTKKFKGTSIGVFIGPEGGFSNDEIALAGERHNFCYSRKENIENRNCRSCNISYFALRIGGIKVIYFDNGSTTKISEPVYEKFMHDFLKNNFANPSSLHSIGFEAERN